MTEAFQDGNRVKHAIYGEGVITGHWKHTYEPEMLWHVRFDDPGIDDDILPTSRLKLISTIPEANKAFIFPNGNITVFDKNGQQIPELQGSWINFDYLRKFAEVVVKDNVRVTGLKQMTGAAQDSFLAHLKSATRELGEKLYNGERECTCNDYPHHELCGAVQDYPDQEGK